MARENGRRIKTNPNAIFVTLTLEDKWYEDIEKKYNIKGENSVATQAMRLWLERVRKITKKSIKHWCITELGVTYRDWETDRKSVV